MPEARLRFTHGLLAIVALWLALRVLYWNGYYTEDAPGYVTDAIWLALGNYHARDHVNGLNVGTYLPVAIPIWLMGKSEVALGLWPMLCSLLGLLSLAALSRMFFGPALGLLAAFLYATYPGDVFFSTVVMPDAVQAGWVSVSMFLVAAAAVHPLRRRRLIMAAAGVAIGVCHLARANDVLLLPVGVGVVAIGAVPWNRKTRSAAAGDGAAYIAGWALIVAAEGAVYLWATQDFFHRFHELNRHYGDVGSIARAGLNTDSRTIPLSLFSPLAWWSGGGWGRFNEEQSYHALLFCWSVVFLAIGAAAAAVARPRLNRRTIAGVAIAVVWLTWPLLYHQFGSQSLTQFVPMHRLSRHLVVYAPAAILAAVAGCALIGETLGMARWPAAQTLASTMGVAVLVMHTSLNWSALQVASGGFQRIDRTYVRIRAHLPPGVDTVVGDPGDLHFLDFSLNPLGSTRVRMVPFAAYSSCDQIGGGVVLTKSNPGWEGSRAPVIQETVARLPCLEHPQSTWRLLYDGYPGEGVPGCSLTNGTRDGRHGFWPLPRPIRATATGSA